MLVSRCQAVQLPRYQDIKIEKGHSKWNTLFHMQMREKVISCGCSGDAGQSTGHS
jgi:hypothetical protein